jgi:Splicing factor 3a, subunit 3
VFYFSPLAFSVPYVSYSAISLLFSGEEAYGKYLDLYANHTAYNNLKNLGRRPGYLQYLDLLLVAQSGPLHQELSKETKFTKDYELSVHYCSIHSSTLLNHVFTSDI